MTTQIIIKSGSIKPNKVPKAKCSYCKHCILLYCGTVDCKVMRKCIIKPRRCTYFEERSNDL